MDQYIVVTESDVNCFLTPNHYFTKELLLTEIMPVGFIMSEFYDDIAGKEFSGVGETICGVFTK
jgi:hypothetical protein